MTQRSDVAATRGDALLSEVVQAHGGAERWAKAHTVSAHVQVRGLLPTWKFFSRDEVRVESDGKLIERRTQARRALPGRGALRRIPRWDTIDAPSAFGSARTR